MRPERELTNYNVALLDRQYPLWFKSDPSSERSNAQVSNVSNGWKADISFCAQASFSWSECPLIQLQN